MKRILINLIIFVLLSISCLAANEKSPTNVLFTDIITGKNKPEKVQELISVLRKTGMIVNLAGSWNSNERLGTFNSDSSILEVEGRKCLIRIGSGEVTLVDISMIRELDDILAYRIKAFEVQNVSPVQALKKILVEVGKRIVTLNSPYNARSRQISIEIQNTTVADLISTVARAGHLSGWSLTPVETKDKQIICFGLQLVDSIYAYPVDAPDHNMQYK